MTSPASRAARAHSKQPPASPDQATRESTFQGGNLEAAVAEPRGRALQLAPNNVKKDGSVGPHSSASEPQLDLPQIIEAARAAKGLITNAPIDQIAEARTDVDGWLVRVDVIEERARIGGNDLITSYRLMLDASGELRGFTRTGKGRREDRVCEGSAG